MDKEEEQRFRQELADIVAAPKQIDAVSDWKLVPHRETQNLRWQSAVRLNGILGRGISVLIFTPLNAWEEDIYGQITVNSSITLGKAARLLPVEYKPKSAHRNGICQADSAYSLQTYRNRYHPWALNKGCGVDVFFQRAPGIAAPLPEEVRDYQSYLKFCAELWKCDDIRNLPQPPWNPSLL